MAKNEMLLDSQSEQQRAMTYLKPLVDKIGKQEGIAKRIKCALLACWPDICGERMPGVRALTRERAAVPVCSSQEVLFGLVKTKFNELAEVAEDVRLKYSLWESQMRWDTEAATWKHMRFSEIQLDSLEATVSAFSKRIIKLERGLPPNKARHAIALGCLVPQGVTPSSDCRGSTVMKPPTNPTHLASRAAHAVQQEKLVAG